MACVQVDFVQALLPEFPKKSNSCMISQKSKQTLHSTGIRRCLFLKMFEIFRNLFFSKFFEKKLSLFLKMGCPALGVSVAFLKQPDAVPGRAPLKK
jgi:hypothetical protein